MSNQTNFVYYTKLKSPTITFFIQNFVGTLPTKVLGCSKKKFGKFSLSID
jgi:hypothetical protein